MQPLSPIAMVVIMQHPDATRPTVATSWRLRVDDCEGGDAAWTGGATDVGALDDPSTSNNVSKRRCEMVRVVKLTFIISTLQLTYLEDLDSALFKS